MKFLIINKPTGHDHGIDDSPATIRNYAGRIKEAIDKGVIEDAYVLLSGGHMYIVDADSSEELVSKVRYNPLFRKSHTEIIPIEPALGYLEAYAAHLEKD
jgi:hypothetical protein